MTNARSSGDEMVNKPKAIGTAAETAVVRYLRANGFPQAERRALRGNYDCGDVTGMPGVVVEVKGGDVAKQARQASLVEWRRQTEVERKNAQADIGILVLQRRGYGAERAGDWWAEIDAGEITNKIAGHLRMTLSQAVSYLRNSGYGEPL